MSKELDFENSLTSVSHKSDFAKSVELLNDIDSLEKKLKLEGEWYLDVVHDYPDGNLYIKKLSGEIKKLTGASDEDVSLFKDIKERLLEFAADAPKIELGKDNKLALMDPHLEHGGVNSLNTAFFLMAVISHIQDSKVVNKSAPVSIVNKIIDYASLTGSGLFVADDVAKFADLFSTEKGALASIGELFSKAAFGGNMLLQLGEAANTIYEMATLKDKELMPIYAAKLSNELLMGGYLGASLTATEAVGTILGPLFVPFLGLTMGIMPLASAYTNRSVEAEHIVQLMERISDSFSQGLSVKDGLLRADGAAAITNIDLVKKTVEYGRVTFRSIEGTGSGHTYTGGLDHYFGAPGPIQSKNNNVYDPDCDSIDVYQALGNGSKIQKFKDDSTAALYLPSQPQIRFAQSYDDLPGARFWNDKGAQVLDKIRNYYGGEKFVWRYYALFDYVMDKCIIAYDDTPVNVVLDSSSRTVIVPDIPKDILKYMHFDLQGGGGAYNVILPKSAPDLTISPSSSASENWNFNIDQIFGADGDFRSINASSQKLEIAGAVIHFSSIAKNITLTNTIDSALKVSLIIGVNASSNAKTLTLALDESNLGQSITSVIKFFHDHASALSLVSDGNISASVYSHSGFVKNGILNLNSGDALFWVYDNKSGTTQVEMTCNGELHQTVSLKGYVSVGFYKNKPLYVSKDSAGSIDANYVVVGEAGLKGFEAVVIKNPELMSRLEHQVYQDKGGLRKWLNDNLGSAFVSSGYSISGIDSNGASIEFAITPSGVACTRFNLEKEGVLYDGSAVGVFVRATRKIDRLTLPSEYMGLVLPSRGSSVIISASDIGESIELQPDQLPFDRLVISLKNRASKLVVKIDGNQDDYVWLRDGSSDLVFSRKDGTGRVIKFDDILPGKVYNNIFLSFGNEEARPFLSVTDKNTNHPENRWYLGKYVGSSNGNDYYYTKVDSVFTITRVVEGKEEQINPILAEDISEVTIDNGEPLVFGASGLAYRIVDSQLSLVGYRDDNGFRYLDGGGDPKRYMVSYDKDRLPYFMDVSTGVIYGAQSSLDGKVEWGPELMGWFDKTSAGLELHSVDLDKVIVGSASLKQNTNLAIILTSLELYQRLLTAGAQPGKFFLITSNHIQFSQLLASAKKKCEKLGVGVKGLGFVIRPQSGHSVSPGDEEMSTTSFAWTGAGYVSLKILCDNGKVYDFTSGSLVGSLGGDVSTLHISKTNVLFGGGEKITYPAFSGPGEAHWRLLYDGKGLQYCQNSEGTIYVRAGDKAVQDGWQRVIGAPSGLIIGAHKSSDGLIALDTALGCISIKVDKRNVELSAINTLFYYNQDSTLPFALSEGDVVNVIDKIFKDISVDEKISVPAEGIYVKYAADNFLGRYYIDGKAIVGFNGGITSYIKNDHGVRVKCDTWTPPANWVSEVVENSAGEVEIHTRRDLGLSLKIQDGIIKLSAIDVAAFCKADGGISVPANQVGLDSFMQYVVKQAGLGSTAVDNVVVSGLPDNKNIIWPGAASGLLDKSGGKALSSGNVTLGAATGSPPGEVVSSKDSQPVSVSSLIEREPIPATDVHQHVDKLVMALSSLPGPSEAGEALKPPVTNSSLLVMAATLKGR